MLRGLSHFGPGQIRRVVSRSRCLDSQYTCLIKNHGRLSVNKFANNGYYAGSLVMGLRKASLYGKATTLTPCVWDNVKYSSNDINSIQPASDLGTSSVDGTEYLMASYSVDSVWKGTLTGE